MILNLLVKESIEKMEIKLYVGNLSYDTTDQDLRTAFAEAGTVGSVDVIMDHQTGRSKGFAFVTMSTQAEAEKAIKLFDGKDLNDRKLKVNIAQPKEDRPRSFNSNNRSRRDQR